ncbi:MAG: hypothetical protein KAV00_12030 [Phycisphaerae bacterium]|nr:hypothetical protein [Phycisphaerae bacterium]
MNIWICQIGIFVFGLSAIWLLSGDKSYGKWGFLLGLLGQPFWFWTAATHRQWGVFVLATAYTFAWCHGIYTHILKGKRAE